MKVSNGTIARTVILVVALANQGLTAFGKNPLPFANDEIENFISLAFTIIASITTWWKNNSFTKKALRADELLNHIRKEEKI